MTNKIASFRISELEPIPVYRPYQEDNGDLCSRFIGSVSSDVRTKPSYTDCWVLNPSEGLDVIASYRTDLSGILVGNAPNGETEYVVSPLEYSYPDELNSLITDMIEDIRSDYRQDGGRLDRDSISGKARSILTDNIPRLEEICGEGTDIETLINDLCKIAYRYSVGPGIFDILLSDPHIEDVFLDAPCSSSRIYVTINGLEGLNSHMRCRTNLMVEPREVSNLINILKRESGLRYSQSNPVMETDFPGYEARATVVGYPMSPSGDAIAIRKHSKAPWTLSRLVYNGTLDPKSAGILSFLVDNRCTFLICGPRGAGKSSLLSALLFEFPLSQRILTIEDTVELPGDAMRKLGYKVQSILVDDRMGGDQQSRSDEALRVSMRMGESAIVLGEVRGDEARTLYQSMRVGRAGSSIMGTIHGDSAESVYQRVVYDIGVSPEAFMATDVVITLGTVRDRRNGHLIRRMNELVSTGSEPGSFVDISDSDKLLASPVMSRAIRSSQLGKGDVAKEIRARALMRSILAEAGRDDDRFLGPEWIVIANDILLKSDRTQSAERIAEALGDRISAR